jgi:hypothetical protein
MLNIIYNKLIDNLSGMISTASSYYTTTQTVQEEDLAKASFPLHNLYLYPSDNATDNRYYTGMNSERYVARFQIKSYDKIPYEASDNAVFLIDLYLNKLVEDIKKMINEDFTLTGSCQGIYYLSSNRINLNTGDIFIPKYLVTELEVPYTLGSC